MKSVLFAGVASVCVFGLFAPSAQAQVESGSDATTNVGEVVVTAQRRNERLQDVPISVTALTERQIAAAGVMPTTDLAKITPGMLTIQGSGFYTPYIRGVGAKTITPGNESTVATYVDGVYQTDKQGLLLSGFSDVRRLEVLRGPQGTLFGRNATGGAVLVTTRGPSNTFASTLEGTYGSEEHGARAFMAGPIAASLSASIAAFYRRQDDYIQNLNPANGAGKEVGSAQSMGVRAKLRWDPTSSLSATLAVDMAESNDEGPWAPQAIEGAGQTTAEGTARARGIAIPDIRLNRPAFAGESRPLIDSKGAGQSLTIVWDAEALTLKSITAHRQDKNTGFLDMDASPLPLFYFRTFLKSNVWQQEITLASRGDGPLNWLGGAYFLHYRDGYAQLDQNVGVAYPYSPAVLATRPAGSAHIDQNSFVTVRSTGAFGEVGYAFTPQTKVTVGLRYTDEKHELDPDNFSQTTIPNGAGGVRVLAPTTVTALCAANPNCRSLSNPFNEWSGRAVLSHEFSDRAMAYLSYNRGFKSGVYNISTISSANVVPTLPETVNAYEIGMKSEVLDGRLTLNAAAYYNDYKDMQVAVTIPGNTTQISINAASAKIAGVEVESTLRATEYLTLQAGLSVFLKAEYGSFANCSVFTANPAGGNVTASTDCSGRGLPGTPDTFNIRAEYRVPLAGKGELVFNGLYAYSGAFDYYPYASAATRAPRQSAINTVNLSAKWISPDRHLSATVWGRDLADQDDMFRGLFANSFGYQTTFARGATYGVTIGYDF